MALISTALPSLHTVYVIIMSFWPKGLHPRSQVFRTDGIEGTISGESQSNYHYTLITHCLSINSTFLWFVATTQPMTTWLPSIRLGLKFDEMARVEKMT